LPDATLEVRIGKCGTPVTSHGFTAMIDDIAAHGWHHLRPIELLREAVSIVIEVVVLRAIHAAHFRKLLM